MEKKWQVEDTVKVGPGARCIRSRSTAGQLGSLRQRGSGCVVWDLESTLNFTNKGTGRTRNDRRIGTNRGREILGKGEIEFHGMVGQVGLNPQWQSSLEPLIGADLH